MKCKDMKCFIYTVTSYFNSSLIVPLAFLASSKTASRNIAVPCRAASPLYRDWNTRP